MNDDRNRVATVGDLHDLRTELSAELKNDMFEEMGRLANAIMEHMTTQIRGLNDQWKAVQENLDAHIADATVHRKPTRARRS